MAPRRLRRAAGDFLVRCGARAGFAAALLLTMIVCAVAEDIGVTSFYPSPRGVYRDLAVITNLGVGTMAPATNLHINGTTRLSTGTEAPGRVLTSDGAGNATWTDYGVPPGLIAMFDGGCPAGWVGFGAFNGRAPRGAAAPGGVGGA